MEELLKKIQFNIREIKSNSDGIDYEIKIFVPMEIGWIERMKFITETSNERVAYQLHHAKNQNGYVEFTGNIFLPTKAIYHYYFSFEANQDFIYYKKENKANYKSITKNDMWKMSVNFYVPDWAKGKIMYHIFVDRFNRKSNEDLFVMPNRVIHRFWNDDFIIGPDEMGRWNTDFYGGNIEGIIDKLDYIKSLGVSIIYLSPVVFSQSNHRYDTSDYEIVDPYVGCNDDLKRLCNAAHQKGMKIILDAVFNHTGNDSIYFNEYGTFHELGAYQSENSKYFTFYRKHYFNNHVYFDYWWGMKNLPVCDGTNKDWQDYIYGKNGIIDLWFSLGIDGLRLDVADELTDEFIEGIRRAVKRNKQDGLILGEVWKNPMRMYRGYLESGKGMDTVMNYPLVNALIRYYKYGEYNLLSNTINEILTEYPQETINSLMNFTSTHDISRAINIFSTNEFQYHGEWAWDLNNPDREYQKDYQINYQDYQLGKKIYQSYLYSLCFLPGILSIFYGDEIGMEGLGNLANRRPFTWDKIDNDILETVKKIGYIRGREKFLENADLEINDINDKYMSFIRKSNQEQALVYLSRTKDKVGINIPKEFSNEKVFYYFTNSINW